MSKPEFQTALDLMGKFDQDRGIRDIEATIHHIRRTMDVPKIGCVGYCLGGRLAYMTAARTDIECQCRLLRRGNRRACCMKSTPSPTR